MTCIPCNSKLQYNNDEHRHGSNDTDEKCKLCDSRPKIITLNGESGKIDETVKRLQGEQVKCIKCDNILLCSVDENIDYLLKVCKLIREGKTNFDLSNGQDLIAHFNAMVANQIV